MSEWCYTNHADTVSEYKPAASDEPAKIPAIHQHYTGATLFILGSFSYCNPTKLYFGKDALDYLGGELNKYGKNVVLVYGGGSIKKNGIYDAVMKILKDCDKNVAEISGVMPNPTVDKLYEGVEIARKHNADLLLAVGGGSVIHYSKASSVSVPCVGVPRQ